MPRPALCSLYSQRATTGLYEYQVVAVDGRYAWYLQARLVVIVYVASPDEFVVTYVSVRHGLPGSWYMSSIRPCERRTSAAWAVVRRRRGERDLGPPPYRLALGQRWKVRLKPGVQRW